MVMAKSQDQKTFTIVIVNDKYTPQTYSFEFSNMIPLKHATITQLVTADDLKLAEKRDYQVKGDLGLEITLPKISVCTLVIDYSGITNYFTCLKAGTPVGVTELWWDFTPTAAKWSCNRWRPECGNECEARAWTKPDVRQPEIKRTDLGQVSRASRSKVTSVWDCLKGDKYQATAGGTNQSNAKSNIKSNAKSNAKPNAKPNAKSNKSNAKSNKSNAKSNTNAKSSPNKPNEHRSNE
ncbi:hypothetical protein HK102_008371 [Quaeritorhiza haematococci]|nr:hypothetical protein HK102_008371 [Quaeritorhiza haematococci]